MFRVRWMAATAVSVLLAGSAAQAQATKDFKSWYGHVAGGYALAEEDASDAVDDGFNLTAGATWWPSASPVGLRMELGYNQFDIKGDVLADLDASDGDVEVWSLEAGGLWGSKWGETVGFYVGAGIGGYRLEATLTDPGLYTGIICDPWYWWYCVPGTVSGDVIVGHADTTKFGWNGTVGLSFELESGSTIYVEATYHQVQTKQNSAYVPIQVGFRW